MKKILLNLGYDYFSNNRTGVGTYAGNIIWGLNVNYDIIVPKDYLGDLPSNANKIYLTPFKKRFMGILKKIIKVDLFFKGYDIVISGGFCFKHSKKTKQIIIVHDLMSFTEPENYTLKQRLYHKLASTTYKNADKIIAVSQTTKQVLHDLFKIDYNKIIVIPNITSFYIEHKEKKDFLFIGDMRKTKNLKYLILGFAEYIKMYEGNEKLIIAGNKKYEYESLQYLVDKLKLSNRISFPGYITEEQKIDLFSKAKGFVFLSNNEGFGIPLLEAAVNQIPVVCSDIPVFHEVLNEQFAIFVNNKNPKEIANSLRTIQSYNIEKNECEKLKKRYSSNTFNKDINYLISQEL